MISLQREMRERKMKGGREIFNKLLEIIRGTRGIGVEKVEEIKRMRLNRMKE